MTAIGPVVALEGTVAVICMPELTVNDASDPLNQTVDAELKLVPLMVTVVPAAPFVGVKLMIPGVG